MKALIVYDSVFGNTEKIAQAIGKALGDPKDVALCRVGDASLDQLKGIDVIDRRFTHAGIQANPRHESLSKEHPGEKP